MSQDCQNNQNLCQDGHGGAKAKQTLNTSTDTNTHSSKHTKYKNEDNDDAMLKRRRQPPQNNRNWMCCKNMRWLNQRFEMSAGADTKVMIPGAWCYEKNRMQCFEM